MEDHSDERPPIPSALDVDDDSAEATLSHREKNAQRAFRSAIFCLLFFPLLPYAYWLLFCVYRSHGRLAGRPRRQVLIAAAGTLGAPALLAILIVAMLLKPNRPESDLRELAHPADLIGVWAGTEQTAHGEVQMILELRRGGKVRFRESGAADTDCTGDWGFANHALYLHITKAARGGERYLQKLIGWDMVSCTDAELSLDDGKTRLRRQR